MKISIGLRLFLGIVVLVVLGIIIISNRRTQIPTKYIKYGNHFSCVSEYKWGELERIVCFDSSQNVILVDSFENDVLYGTHKSYYGNGKIKLEGAYKRGAESGIWHEYYPNGELKTYSYYSLEGDSSTLIYQKNYDSSGELISLIYPINFYGADTSAIVCDKPFRLIVELAYSEFSSPYLMCLFDTDGDNSNYEDTVYYNGTKVLYTFTPPDTGWHELNGLLIEGNNNNKYGGERKFTYQYYAYPSTKSNY